VFALLFLIVRRPNEVEFKTKAWLSEKFKKDEERSGVRKCDVFLMKRES